MNEIKKIQLISKKKNKKFNFKIFKYNTIRKKGKAI